MTPLKYSDDFKKRSVYSINKGVLDLGTLATNMAARCFILDHKSPNADILRQFLIENFNGNVEFAEE